MDISALSKEELKNKIKELRIRTEESGRKIASHFKNPIDNFTDMDELLRENLILQRDLIEEQHISNQLLLHILFKEDSGGSIVPYEPQGIDTENILEGLKGGEEIQTIIIQSSGKDAIYKEEGAGMIDLIKLVSSSLDADNKDYSIEVKCDDNLLYNDTWDNLEIRSISENGISCYEDDEYNLYILCFIGSICYSESFEVKVFKSEATFSSFQLKFHRKV